MLSALYKRAYYGYFSAVRMMQNLMRQGVEAFCPEQHTQHLQDCYKDAATIRTQILHLTAHPNLETAFLDDFFEVEGGDSLKTYGALMSFWAKANKAFPSNDPARIENPRVFQITRAANGFATSFEGLPPIIKCFANASLGLQKDIIIRHIADKSAEYIRFGGVSEGISASP